MSYVPLEPPGRDSAHPPVHQQPVRPPGPTGTYPPSALSGGSPGQPADLGLRLAARLIDAAITLGPLFVFGLIGATIDSVGSTSGFGEASEPNPVFGILALPAYAWAFLYEFVMLGRYGQTLGKRALKLRVVSVNGQPLSWGGAALRVYVQSVVSACTCGFGGLLFALSPLFDSGPYKRGWPDQIASSVVVRDAHTGAQIGTPARLSA